MCFVVILYTTHMLYNVWLLDWNNYVFYWELLFGELADGKRSVGGQKHFKDTLKASLKSFDIDINTWDKIAVDRPTWRSQEGLSDTWGEEICGSQKDA